MDRRALITTAGALALTGCATPTSNQNNGSGFNSNQSAPDKAATYTRDELVPAVSDFFGVTVESAGAVIEKVFGDNGRPTGYIAGEEASAAVTVGARYGNGRARPSASTWAATPAGSSSCATTCSTPTPFSGAFPASTARPIWSAAWA